MNPESNHIPCANIAPGAAACQGLHDKNSTLVVVSRKSFEILETFPQPRWGELDGNGVQNREVACEYQDSHQDEE
jgi:hypothetical protein